MNKKKTGVTDGIFVEWDLLIRTNICGEYNMTLSGAICQF